MDKNLVGVQKKNVFSIRLMHKQKPNETRQKKKKKKRTRSTLWHLQSKLVDDENR